ncbi:14203_t:CDS:1 [Funneliformis mosseae]|uniref:14203_t:CDS:1 n=1 Tax=Funneliformis mosseae TaxID=27381 RepID=A0A9N9DC80_FUNMO|nr:14203_t:CDS:1 [Funneliformis mosseae]
MSTEMKTNAFQERIILNVGGIKYETFRSTLIAYPETYLGTMFADRNRELLRPTNDNEYFIDRDGKLFRYILQFYRTGKIQFPPSKDNKYSKEEIYVEIDFFQLPNFLHTQQVNLTLSQRAQNASAKKVDAFVNALIECINEAMECFEIAIPFSIHRIVPKDYETYWDEYEKLAPFVRYIRPFCNVGYFILERFHKEIGNSLKKELGTDLGWIVEKHNNDVAKMDYYRINITIPEEFYDTKKILQNSNFLESLPE